MSTEYSAEGLLKFLKDAAMAGQLNPATARSRRNAAEQLLAQLEESERADLRELDVDQLDGRFHKLQGSSIRPEALKIYLSRFRAALDDYFRYVVNPQGFVSGGGENRQLRKRSSVAERTAEETALEEIKLGVPENAAEILPIPLREDLVVFVQGIPLDLTTAEADKIARVVRALATEQTS